MPSGDGGGVISRIKLSFVTGFGFFGEGFIFATTDETVWDEGTLFVSSKF